MLTTSPIPLKLIPPSYLPNSILFLENGQMKKQKVSQVCAEHLLLVVCTSIQAWLTIKGHAPKEI